MGDFNVLIGDVPKSDVDLFFGPLTTEDIFLKVPVEWGFPQLLKFLGLFRSTSEAMRNGWNKPIPEGFTDIERFGKLNHRITVYKTDVSEPAKST